MVGEVEGWAFDGVSLDDGSIQTSVSTPEDPDQLTRGCAVELLQRGLGIGDTQESHLSQGKVAAGACPTKSLSEASSEEVSQYVALLPPKRNYGFKEREWFR